MQFGYKVGTSTTQCSWLVMEVANYFLRNKTCPIITLLDCSKAFDTCQFSTLFQRLLDRGMPLVRVIIKVYEDQYAWVKWGNSRSTIFSIVNGTRQGSILSHSLFAVYVDELLVELRNLGLGCMVAGVYMGAVGFCDDLLLMSPTRDGMQVMLDTCQRFARRYNLQFSTDNDPIKSKTRVRGLLSSPCSMEVAVMCGVAMKDIRFVTVANIALLREETGLNPVLASTAQVKVKLLSKASGVPDMDNWRLACLGKLLTARGEAHYMAEEEIVRLTSLIDSVCVN